MRRGSVAVYPQSGGAISTVLVGLIGFASGALVVGTVALIQHPGTVNEPAAPAAVSSSTHESVPVANTIEGGKDWPADPHPTAWPYESATRTPTRAPGLNRPDRLSAPENVVFDGAGP